MVFYNYYLKLIHFHISFNKHSRNPSQPAVCAYIHFALETFYTRYTYSMSYLPNKQNRRTLRNEKKALAAAAAVRTTAIQWQARTSNMLKGFTTIAATYATELRWSSVLGIKNINFHLKHLLLSCIFHIYSTCSTSVFWFFFSFHDALIIAQVFPYGCVFFHKFFASLSLIILHTTANECITLQSMWMQWKRNDVRRKTRRNEEIIGTMCITILKLL